MSVIPDWALNVFPTVPKMSRIGLLLLQRAGEVRGQPLRFTLCDGEKKNGQGVNLREEERNPWNLSQEVFDKKKTVVMSFHFIGNSTNNFLFPCLIISVSIIYIKILSTETWHRVYDLNIPFLWRWSSVQYFESDFEECLTGQGLMERETNAFKSCPPEERLNRL